MNLNIVKKRLDEVIDSDATAESLEDFFATHVPVDQLQLLDNFELQPSLGNEKWTEEEIFNSYIINPNNSHQFIAVYGEAGTGKSHLIRWFKEKFENVKPLNEVVLFISRNDNSLKGTIKQLLNHPEVKNIENKELFDRLTTASSSIDPQKLKDMIYHNFIIEVNSDLETANSEASEIEHSVVLKMTTKKNLPAFLNNDLIRKHMLRDNGPVYRVFSKVAEQAIVDTDIEAKFIPEDFMIPSEIYNKMLQTADVKAQKLAKKLRVEDSGFELAQTIASYLNDFVDTVIQTCAGIEPADFELLFMNIREQLFDLDKTLTVFIEDITSTTGVNKALLSALMTPHTVVQGRQVCRISSIVGSTSGYIQSDIPSNYRQRVSKYVYIPTGAIENERLFEFVGKYINALSLEKDDLKTWVDNGAIQTQLPIHNLTSGLNWDVFKIGEMEFNLYPFTKNAIVNLYNTQLTQKTPRYIIREIIRPVLSDVLYRKNSFPDGKYKITDYGNDSLSRIVRARIPDTKESDRLIRFMYIWGNGKNEQYTKDSKRFICGLNETNYKDFDLPIIDLETVVVQEERVSESIVSTNSESSIVITTISSEAKSKFARAYTYLDKWVNGERINISATSGESGIIRNALDDIKVFIIGAIDWQIEGLSLDLRKKVRDGNHIVTLSNVSTNSKGYIKLECSRSSAELLLSFIKWRVYGNGSWNYENSHFDCFTITNWFLNNKKLIIETIKNTAKYKYPYTDYAIAVEIYKKLLNGTFKHKNLNELKPIDFYLSVTPNNLNSHSKKWNETIKWMSNKNNSEENLEAVQNTFNLRQGVTNATKVFIDYPSFKTAIKRVVKLFDSNYLVLSLPSEDALTKRYDICKFYVDLRAKIAEALKEEINSIKSYAQTFCEVFNIELDETITEDEIIEVLNNIGVYYTEVDNAGIHLQSPYLMNLYNETRQIAQGINILNEIYDDGCTQSSLIELSKNPIEKVSEFYRLILKLKKDIEIVDKEIERNKINEIGSIESSHYDDEKAIIEECLKTLERVED